MTHKLSTSSPDHWRALLYRAKQQLITRYRIERNPANFLHGYSHAVDDIIAAIWNRLIVYQNTSLIAVGGYGRTQLFPHSDIDLLILLPASASSEPGLEDAISDFISQMWDSGLEVSHSVRTCAECLSEAEKDITVKTSLLEKRLIAGNSLLYHSLTQQLDDQNDVLSFFEGKILEQKHRHSRVLGVTNNLEPNIKEGPGGLRDLQTLLWISRAIGLGDNWDALAQQGILTTAETRLIKHSEKQLQKLRIDLHLLAQRREDRLIFDFQQQLGQTWELYDTMAKRASEQVMQLYYRAAKTVNQLNGILLSTLKDHIYLPIPRRTQRLNEHFISINGMLDIDKPNIFKEQPSTILLAFLMLQRYTELDGHSPNMLRTLWHARSRINERFRRDPNNRAIFMEILRSPNLTHSLRQMNLYGVLGKYLPSFGRIVGQMQHDLFHTYTVDEHILMVVHNLRRFANHAFSHEHPLLFYLITHFERPEVLYIAGLFHDIAKGRGGDHSQQGANDAQLFCMSHDLSDEDGELVTWLVAQHLTLSQVAQKQDIYNPEIVCQFAKTVSTPRRLTALYLLTVADIRGTSPKVWNAWKAKLLEDLYLATFRLLARGGTLNMEIEREDRKRQARALLRLHAIPESAEDKLWDKFDAMYFLGNEAKEIAWHTRLINRFVDTPHPIVGARLSDGQEGLQVLVYSPDQPRLFVRICAFFDRMNYSIADAKIYTTRHGYALDTFHVFIPIHEQDGNYRDRINFIEFELRNTLLNPCEPNLRRNGRISRHLKHFPITPHVTVQANDQSPFYTLSIVAGDQPGLLAQIAQILANHQINVHSAKIMTLGGRIEDSFLITGPYLGDDKAVVRLESELINITRL